MYELPWFKTETNIFSNRKIQLILKLTDGDTYFRVWIQLIALAVECNNKGRLEIGGDFMELQKVQRTTLTMKEAAEYLGISYWLINQLVRRRQIPCSKVGGKFLFRVQVLDEYLNRKEKESVSY